MVAASTAEIAASTSAQHSAVRQPGARLVSLDAFRGATIAAMILVNDPGSWAASYAPLQHAAWNGWTPTDLVFPFFLFIMGVAMEFSFASRRNNAKPDRRGLLLHVLVRAIA